MIAGETTKSALFWSAMGICAIGSLAECDAFDRAESGLVAFYDFGDDSGTIVKDRSGISPPINLRIMDQRAVRRSTGSLEVRGKTMIRSERSPSRLLESIRRTSAMSVEAWIRSADMNQSGPARIVTISKNTSERNFTLGQDGTRIDGRLRTTRTSKNGIPSLASPNRSLGNGLTHVVYTHDRSGRTRLFVNGKQRAEKSVSGSMSNWNESFQLALANELSNDRPWRGTFHMVAIYNRDLSAKEVARNFAAGQNAGTSPALAEQDAAQHFETKIAPLLSAHCLECHDSVTKEAGLDLSRKSTAFAGGDSGKPIIAGQASQSLLWKSVQSDEMPQDRPPLSENAKNLLRDWIDSGAAWSLDYIDPAIYKTDERATKNWLQRLTRTEYVATVKSTFGVDISDEANKHLPADLRADGFSNTAYNLNVDLEHVEAYAQLAEMIVRRMDVEAFARKFTKSKQLTDNNMRGLISAMGKRILRGPLDEYELANYRGISTTVASTGGDFKEAVGYTIEAMLQSPRFIYRIEHQRGDGTNWPADDYELASRLSYIIWGSAPDEELMRAADAGELDRDGVAKQAARMLKDPRAIERSLQFASQWLNLDRLSNLRPDANKFPNWDRQIADDMRQETLAFFKEVVWTQNRPLADLLNAQITFATPRLAKHYGLKVQGKQPDQPVRYELSSVPARGGILTQGSVLTIGGDEASMVTRGLFVLEDLLFSEVGDPPPGLDVTPIPSSPGRSQRTVAEQRIGNASCGGCHSRFEPLAFGLERFDGLGGYQKVDRFGNELREDGEIHFPNEDKPRKYSSAAELMDLLAGSPRVRQCITRKVTQFAIGRPLVATDARQIDKIHKQAQANGGTYSSLMLAIVLSDLVQMTRTESD